MYDVKIDCKFCFIYILVTPDQSVAGHQDTSYQWLNLVPTSLEKGHVICVAGFLRGIIRG